MLPSKTAVFCLRIDYGYHLVMKTMRSKLPLLLTLIALAGCSPDSSSQTSLDADLLPAIVSETYTVSHNGIEIRLYKKQLQDTKPQANKTLVLLPSATFSVLPNWDLQHDDSSLMDHFAKSGWVVFAIDLPGYGNSDNPPEPETFGAVESTEYINTAVNFICEDIGIETVNLLGWSWGAQAAGRFTNTHPERVSKLVLYGFTYQRRLPESVLPKQPYRVLDFEEAISDFVDGCFQPGLPDAYANAVLDSDHDQLVPSGPLNDFVNRLPLVAPDQLAMPVLVISGQYELEQPPNSDGDYSEYFQARRKDLERFCKQVPNGQCEMAVISGGGHAIHLEKPKHQWRNTVLEFFAGDSAPQKGQD